MSLIIRFSVSPGFFVRFVEDILDSTYTNDGDDSIAIAKTTARACAETAGTDKNIASVNKKTTGASRRRPSTNKAKEADTKSDKYCVDDCNLKTGDSM